MRAIKVNAFLVMIQVGRNDTGQLITGSENIIDLTKVVEQIIIKEIIRLGFCES